jgi:hypothetical protein
MPLLMALQMVFEVFSRVVQNCRTSRSFSLAVFSAMYSCCAVPYRVFVTATANDAMFAAVASVIGSMAALKFAPVDKTQPGTLQTHATSWDYRFMKTQSLHDVQQTAGPYTHCASC